ncbi:MAG: amidohydrolase [Clostridia bacterium]|nr:amidohydrolase [Clostridia bacterium]
MTILFKNAAVMIDGSRWLANGCAAVDGTKITYVGESIPEGRFDRVIDCAGKLLTPAFYNIHCHSAMTLFRGLGGDLPLQRWLNEKIYPAEDRLNPERVRIGSTLAIAEMIRGGTVSFSDMYFFCDETVKAVLDTGMKVNISRCLLSFSEDSTVKGDSRFDEAVELAKTYHNAGDGRMKIDMSVHAEYTNKARYCREVADYTHAHDLNMQVHVSETLDEHEECKARNHGMTPVEFLLDTGILVPSATGTATAAHCVWLSEGDMELLAENRVTVAHNPVSNLKLASGVANLPLMLKKGVRVGLGTDGAASNNAQSMLRELQTAALIHKGVTRRADIIPTGTICDMAMSGGAIAQGRHDCGVIEEGKRADLVLWDLDAINNIPMAEPYSTLAYSAAYGDVTMTMCDGKILYENGEYKTLDVERLRAEAKPILAHYFD